MQCSAACNAFCFLPHKVHLRATPCHWIFLEKEGTLRSPSPMPPITGGAATVLHGTLKQT